MNIMARINARKIVLSYFYQRNFFLFSFQQENLISEVLFANKIYKTDQGMYEKGKEDLEHKIKDILAQEVDTVLDYIIKNFFDQWKDKIDIDYIFAIAPYLEKYREEIIDKIDQYTDSFKYDEISLINQSIFALGYIERKELKTEKEILINELIELAKRYDEGGSTKLINAIMHKIIKN